MTRKVKDVPTNWFLNLLGKKMSRVHTVKCDWCGKESEARIDHEGRFVIPKRWKWMRGFHAFGVPLKKVAKQMEFCGDECARSYQTLAKSADAAADKVWKETYRAGRVAFHAAVKAKAEAAAAIKPAPAKPVPAAPSNQAPSAPDKVADTFEIGGVANDNGVARFSKLEL
jgi:uncharacterized ferredoxin-like protein